MVGITVGNAMQTKALLGLMIPFLGTVLGSACVLFMRDRLNPLVKVPADPKAKKEYDKKVYDLALTAVVKAQDTLNGNVPFISEDMYNEYSAILKLCNLQLDVFSNRWNVLYLASQEEKEKLDFEDYERTGTINKSMKELNNKVRKYISTLDVIE